MTIQEQIDKLLEIQVRLEEIKQCGDIFKVDDGAYFLDEAAHYLRKLAGQLEEASTEDEDEQEDDERHEERERDLMAYYRER